jgi:DeoR/GlpR family transcriptional regulator of sugar metabolism
MSHSDKNWPETNQGPATTPFENRQKVAPFSKACIGVYIARYLREYARYRAVAIDGGTTNLCVLRSVYEDVWAGRPTVAWVITNHLEGVWLADRSRPGGSNITTVCTGGVLRPTFATFVAEQAVQAVRGSNFCMAVVGFNGFDFPWLEVFRDIENPVKEAMIDGASETVIIPLDATKWGAQAGMSFHTINQIVDLGKKVVLVTCYPNWSDDPALPDAARQLAEERFLAAVNRVEQAWHRGLAIFTATAEPQMQPAAIQFVPLSASDLGLGERLRRTYRESVPDGEKNVKGLIVQLDFIKESRE